MRALHLLPLCSALLSCERVAYWSVSGSDAPDDGSDPTTTTTGTGLGGSTGAGGGSPTTRRMVLDTMQTCGHALYAEVADSAARLEERTATFRSSPTEENRTAARDAWKETVGLWQQAEVLRMGPASPATNPGGQGVRDLIYSWPLVSRCLVEQTLVSEGFADADFKTDALINVRGLVAIEYNLFFEPAENACGPASGINTSGAWAAIAGAELDGRKRAYAAILAEDVRDRAAFLRDAWADGGSYAELVAGIGDAGSPFTSEQKALNALSDGIFYVEREVKDLKIGRPLGLYECTESSCPNTVESQYARVARDHVKNNLLGFERFFSGCDEAPEHGFAGLLRTVGAKDVADDMESALAAALAAADAMPNGDFVVALSEERASLEALHAAVKKLTDLLKTDFVSVLDLELPNIVEGDND
jgi:predicted lipoprotein